MIAKINERTCSLNICYMNDQGIKCRAVLGRIYRSDRFVVRGVGAKSIDCLCGKCDEAAVRNSAGAAFNAVFVAG